MANLTRIKLFTLVLIAGLALQSANAQNARIKIDIDRAIGEVDPNIYGNFTEHLGRHIYGGIYAPGNPLSDEQGYRTDVMEAIKGLSVSVLRYPGGNFVSNYHWMDGVGPVEDRTTRKDYAWDVLESNHFGTNEFVTFAEKIGVEPFFVVNMGTGTIEEAQRWVEYTNVAEGPYYAELRRKHGYEEPHDIKYWGLGNEMDGDWQMGQLSAGDYSKKAKEAAKLMLRTDPDIKLIAAGSSNYRYGSSPDHWNRTVLRELRDWIDYIDLHIYAGNPDDNYYNFVSTPLVLEDRTEIVRGMINVAMQEADRDDRDPIYITWGEYNVWYRARSGAFERGRNALEERYNLEDALVISGFLNAIIRNADIVKMANMAQLVNVIAPIFTSENDLFKQTIYYPLELFANNAHGTSLDLFVECDTYDTDEFYIGLHDKETTTRQTDVPYLDVSATYQEATGEVVINVVNRHRDESIATDIISQTGRFVDRFEVYEVNGPDIKAGNDFDRTLVETERKEEIQADGSTMTYSFPPHSFTMIKGKID